MDRNVRYLRLGGLGGGELSCRGGSGPAGLGLQTHKEKREGGRKVTDMIQENVSVSSQHLSEEDSWTARPAEGVWCNILQRKAELCFVLSAEAVEQVVGQEDRIISNKPELVILVGWT